MKQQCFYILVAADQDKGSESSGSASEEELTSLEVLMPDTPIPLAGRFVIAPLTLTSEQSKSTFGIRRMIKGI